MAPPCVVPLSTRLLYLQIKQIEPIAGSIHLRKKPSLSIPDVEHTILDYHFAAALVELPETDDARAQLWDVVHIRKRDARHSGTGDDGATASDHHPRAIAELDRASDAAVELGERPLEPVMWLLAPESRYHLCSCSPFTAPRQT